MDDERVGDTDYPANKPAFKSPVWICRFPGGEVEIHCLTLVVCESRLTWVLGIINAHHFADDMPRYSNLHINYEVKSL